MILGVHHPALSVPDMDQALEFYCGVLGFETAMEAGWPSGVTPMDEAMALEDSACKIAMIKKGNSCIELFEFTGDNVPAGDVDRPVNKHGITHICLAASEFEKDFIFLEEAGVVFNTEPNGAAPNRWAYGRDPFGNVIELLEHDPASASALSFDD